MHDSSGIESLNAAKIPQFRQRTRQSGVVSPFRLLSQQVSNLAPNCQARWVTRPSHQSPREMAASRRLLWGSCQLKADCNDAVSRTLQRVDFRARLGYTEYTPDTNKDASRPGKPKAEILLRSISGS
jgi:hypothetical protein